MKDSDFIDLANRVIDGVGSEHDRTALNAVLHESTQRRLEYGQLATVSSILDAVRPVEPPAELRDRILARIPRSVPQPAGVPQLSLWDRLVEFLGVRPGIALAYAVATGLVIGGVGIGVLSGPLGTDPSSVVGTLAPGDGLSMVDEASTTVGDGRVDAVLETDGEEFRILLDISAAVPVAVSVTPAAGVAQWDAVSLPGRVNANVTVGSGEIRFGSLTSGRAEVSGRRSGELAVSIDVRSSTAEGHLDLRNTN